MVFFFVVAQSNHNSRESDLQLWWSSVWLSGDLLLCLVAQSSTWRIYVGGPPYPLGTRAVNSFFVLLLILLGGPVGVDAIVEQHTRGLRC